MSTGREIAEPGAVAKAPPNRPDPLHYLFSVLMRRSATQLAALVSVSAAIIYVGTHSYYVEIYRPLGVRPEELGLGYSQSLTDTVSLALAGLLALGLVAVGLKAGVGWAAMIALAIAGLATIFVFNQIPDIRQRLLAGQPIGKNWLTNPLAVRAIQGRVVWLGQPPQRLAHLADHRVILLGSANGLTVIYDARTKQVLRLASSQIAFAARPGSDTAQSPISTHRTNSIRPAPSAAKRHP